MQKLRKRTWMGRLAAAVMAAAVLVLAGAFVSLADESGDGNRNSSVSYLLCLDKDALTRDERSGVCETLIRQNYYTEAYEMICRYGIEGIQIKQNCRSPNY